MQRRSEDEDKWTGQPPPTKTTTAAAHHSKQRKLGRSTSKHSASNSRGSGGPNTAAAESASKQKKPQTPPSEVQHRLHATARQRPGAKVLLPEKFSLYDGKCGAPAPRGSKQRQRLWSRRHRRKYSRRRNAAATAAAAAGVATHTQPAARRAPQPMVAVARGRTRGS